MLQMILALCIFSRMNCLGLIIDLSFTTSDSSVIRFTGGEGVNPTFNTVGGTRFDLSNLTIDADGSSGNLLSVNITENRIDPAVSQLFDLGFDAGVGPNGGLLLARVDFEVVGEGGANLGFALGRQGILQLPNNVINPALGSTGFQICSRQLTVNFGNI